MDTLEKFKAAQKAGWAHFTPGFRCFSAWLSSLLPPDHQRPRDHREDDERALPCRGLAAPVNGDDKSQGEHDPDDPPLHTTWLFRKFHRQCIDSKTPAVTAAGKMQKRLRKSPWSRAIVCLSEDNWPGLGRAFGVRVRPGSCRGC